MKIFFYQNILSFHQSAFIRELSFSNEVCLFVDEELYSDRKDQGWSVPDFGNAKITVNPNIQQLTAAVTEPNSVHIVSTFNAYKISSEILKLSRKYKFKLGVMTEPFNFYGIKGFLRIVYYWTIKIRWNKKVDFILTIGILARNCFKQVGFPENKIFDWAYVTEQHEKIFIENKQQVDRFKPKMIFVGTIDKRKNIIKILDIVTKTFIDDLEEFLIVGNGPDSSILSSYTSNFDKIKFLGSLTNLETLSYMQQSDILVLPSLFDGWGAVINESLTVGTSVICSDRCGAQVLISEDNGRIFSISKNNFANQFYDLKNNWERIDRSSIRGFMLQNVSGISTSNYLVDIINHVYGSTERPIAPWIKNKI